MRAATGLLTLLCLTLPCCTCGRRGESYQSKKTAVEVIDPEEVGRPRPAEEKEPNDSMRQAQDLDQERGVEGRLAPEGDRDWYRLKIEGDGRILTARVSGAAGVDLVLEAWNDKRERLVRVNNTKEGEGEVLINLAVSPGTYYLVVREAKKRRGEGSSAKYRVSYGLRPREEGEELEPNWKASLATPLLVGGEAQGYLGWQTDTDWYRVDLPNPNPSTRLRVEFDGLDEVRANLSLRTGAGAVIQERWGAAGEATILSNIAPLQGQTELYVVLRCGYQFNVESRYALRLLSAVPPGPTEAEPNDVPGSATDLTPGVPVAGVLGDAVDKDLFSVKVSEPGALRVQVVPPLGLDAAIALLDERGSVVWQVDDVGPRETEVMAAVGVRPPRAVFQVWAPHRQKTNAVSSYHIRADLLAEGLWEKEPNDTAASATSWPLDQQEIRGYLTPKKDVDFFRVSVRDEMLRLAVTAPGKLTPRLEVLDPGGASLPATFALGSGGTYRLSAKVGAPGEVLLRLTEAAGASDGREAYRIRRDLP
jgi:hypothetical protein